MTSLLLGEHGATILTPRSFQEVGVFIFARQTLISRRLQSDVNTHVRFPGVPGSGLAAPGDGSFTFENPEGSSESSSTCAQHV